MNNASLWAHVFVTKVKNSPDPQSAAYRRQATFQSHRSTSTSFRLNAKNFFVGLNEYLKKPKLTGRVNLISGEKEDSPEMIAEVFVEITI